MAGYRGRIGGTPEDGEFVNATAINSQITHQRQALHETFRGSLNNADLATSGSLGVAKETSTFFRQFDPEAIMFSALQNLSSAEGIITSDDHNPDFLDEFNPWLFKTFDDIKRAAEEDSLTDNPGIGMGPNLNSPNSDALESAMQGDLELGNFDENMRANFREGKGFGWYDSKHKGSSIGSYLNNKYYYSNRRLSQRPNNPQDSHVYAGERIDTDKIDYKTE